MKKWKIKDPNLVDSVNQCFRMAFLSVLTGFKLEQKQRFLVFLVFYMAILIGKPGQWNLCSNWFLQINYINHWNKDICKIFFSI